MTYPLCWIWLGRILTFYHSIVGCGFVFFCYFCRFENEYDGYVSHHGLFLYVKSYKLLLINILNKTFLWQKHYF